MLLKFAFISKQLKKYVVSSFCSMLCLPIAHKDRIKLLLFDLRHLVNWWEGQQPFWFPILDDLFQWLNITDICVKLQQKMHFQFLKWSDAYLLLFCRLPLKNTFKRFLFIRYSIFNCLKKYPNEFPKIEVIRKHVEVFKTLLAGNVRLVPFLRKRETGNFHYFLGNIYSVRSNRWHALIVEDNFVYQKNKTRYTLIKVIYQRKM